MADYLANGNDLTAIANAIRAKSGTSASLEFPSDFISAVSNISTGTDISDTTLTTSTQMLDGIAAYDANGSKIIGSILARTSLDLTASGATVTVPKGNYASTASKSVASGSVTAPPNISGSDATVTHSGTTLIFSKNILITPTVTTGYISSGTEGNSTVSLTATDANFVAGNIKNGTNVFGVLGTYEGGGTSYATLLATTSLGSISTSSTTATNTNKTTVISTIGTYDLLVVEVSVDSKVNSRHASTCQTIFLTSSSSIGTKNGSAIATATLNTKLSSSGSATTNTSTTKYGIYVNSASLSNNTVTLSYYQRYNSTATGTINGTYTARVYGMKLYNLIGG